MAEAKKLTPAELDKLAAEQVKGVGTKEDHYGSEWLDESVFMAIQDDNGQVRIQEAFRFGYHSPATLRDAQAMLKQYAAANKAEKARLQAIIDQRTKEAQDKAKNAGVPFNDNMVYLLDVQYRAPQPPTFRLTSIEYADGTVDQNPKAGAK